jgi:hypothetical protein
MNFLQIVYTWRTEKKHQWAQKTTKQEIKPWSIRLSVSYLKGRAFEAKK